MIEPVSVTDGTDGLFYLDGPDMPRPIRLLFFAHANSYHTVKWSRFFSERGFRICVLTLEECTNQELLTIPNVEVHFLENGSARMGAESQKLGYLTTVKRAKQLMAEFNPDIVHAHFASSYGLICALSCKQPFYLSVWGNDVYRFPRKTPLHRALLKHALSRCTWLFSTSEAMAAETHKYTRKPIEITPFGVDMELFNPAAGQAAKASADAATAAGEGAAGEGAAGKRVVVGTVKSLEPKYGIDVLLRAVRMTLDVRPDLDLQLRIAGEGTKADEYRALADELGLHDRVAWLGFISQPEAAAEWAGFDIAAVPSIDESESFGVSAVEAQACGTALVISDIPGLMEACNGGKNALVVPRGNAEELAAAIIELADNPRLRASMGAQGRAYVEQAYEVTACFEKVLKIYEDNLAVSRG